VTPSGDTLPKVSPEGVTDYSTQAGVPRILATGQQATANWKQTYVFAEKIS